MLALDVYSAPRALASGDPRCPDWPPPVRHITDVSASAAKPQVRARVISERFKVEVGSGFRSVFVKSFSSCNRPARERYQASAPVRHINHVSTSDTKPLVQTC